MSDPLKITPIVLSAKPAIEHFNMVSKKFSDIKNGMMIQHQNLAQSAIMREQQKRMQQTEESNQKMNSKKMKMEEDKQSFEQTRSMRELSNKEAETNLKMKALSEPNE